MATTKRSKGRANGSQKWPAAKRTGAPNKSVKTVDGWLEAVKRTLTNIEGTCGRRSQAVIAVLLGCSHLSPVSWPPKGFEKPGQFVR
jgi:hypothetical protein